MMTRNANISLPSLVLLLMCMHRIHLGYALENIRQQESLQLQSKPQPQQRELASLQDKWFLQDNGVIFSGLEYSLKYDISDFVINSMIRVSVYDKECKEGGVIIPTSDMSVNLQPDDTPAGVGDNLREVLVDLTLDPEKLDNSVAYNEVTNEDGTTATIEFCFRMGLFTNGDVPIEVNFLQTIVQVTIGLTGGFSIEGINVAPKDKILEETEVIYKAEAFQCNNNNEELSAAELSISRTQGSVLRVCVQPTPEARDDGVVMESIDDFSWNREYGGALGTVTQSAIVNGESAPNFLTELYCDNGAQICAFATVLFSSMYITPGSVSGSGQCSMQFNPNTLRRNRVLRRQQQLQHNNSSSSIQRKIQQTDTTQSGFDLNFPLILEIAYTDQLRLDRQNQSSSTRINIISSCITVGVIVLLHLFLI